MSTFPLGLPDDQTTPSTVSVSEANPTAAKRPQWSDPETASSQRGDLQAPARTDRSEEGYMEKLLLSPEEPPPPRSGADLRVYDLMRTRQLLSVRIGKSRRVPVAALHAYVERFSEH